MNTLSWLLYLADVSDNLNFFLRMMVVISVIGTFFWLLAGAFLRDNCADEKEWANWRRSGLTVILPFFMFGVVIGSLVPSKETIYAITASEMGEKALNTETGNKAVNALNAWLDRQIEGEPKKEKEKE